MYPTIHVLITNPSLIFATITVPQIRARITTVQNTIFATITVPQMLGLGKLLNFL